MGGQSLVQLEASELPAELGLPGAPAATAPAAESAPASSTPAETAPAASAPAETAPATTTPAASAPAETAPAPKAPAETAPAATTPAATTPAATTPAATTPAATAPAETAPAATTTPAETAPKGVPRRNPVLPQDIPEQTQRDSRGHSNCDLPQQEGGPAASSGFRRHRGRWVSQEGLVLARIPASRSQYGQRDSRVFVRRHVGELHSAQDRVRAKAV